MRLGKKLVTHTRKPFNLKIYEDSAQSLLKVYYRSKITTFYRVPYFLFVQLGGSLLYVEQLISILLVLIDRPSSSVIFTKMISLLL